VPKKVEQINDYLFMNTYKSNDIKRGMNEMRVNDNEMSTRWNTKLGQYQIYKSWESPRCIQSKEDKNNERGAFLTFF